MSWASRRRTAYGLGIAIFLLLVIGGPLAYAYLSVEPTCTDGKRNQGESAIDKGGPCAVLDDMAIAPVATLWTRSFRVRDGSYNAVAYLQNPNAAAGVRKVAYRFGLYDERNVIVAERTGETFIMPGATTPLFEGAIDTGSRIVAHTYFEFSEQLTWERLDNTASGISIGNRTVTLGDEPRISATVTNPSVRDLRDVAFIIAVSDPAGNAFAASRTTLAVLPAGASETITFTWPDPFNVTIGSIDITAISVPIVPRSR